MSLTHKGSTYLQFNHKCSQLFNHIVILPFRQSDQQQSRLFQLLYRLFQILSNNLCTEYRLISKKGEGTFSEVLKAQSIKTGKYVAIKCMKNHFDTIEQVNNLREIQALRRLSPHPQIIKLYEVL